MLTLSFFIAIAAAPYPHEPEKKASYYMFQWDKLLHAYNMILHPVESYTSINQIYTGISLYAYIPIINTIVSYRSVPETLELLHTHFLYDVSITGQQHWPVTDKYSISIKSMSYIEVIFPIW